MSAWRGGEDKYERAARHAQTEEDAEQLRREVSQLRLFYSGALGLLSECSVYVPEEVREQIEVAFQDATLTGRFRWRRILNRLEIEVKA